MFTVHRCRPSLVLACLAILSLSACVPQGQRPISGGSTAPSSDPSPSPATGVKVALIVPTGSTRQGVGGLARAIRNAGKMAEADVPSPMQLQVYETVGDAATSVAAARRAVADGAGLILGPLFAENTRAVRQVASRAGVSVISFSTDRTVAGGSVFVSGFLPENEIDRVLEYSRRQGIGALGVFYPETPFGRASFRAARESAGGLGMAVVSSQGYPRSFDGIQNASEPFAAQARANGADAILLPEGGGGLQAVGAFMNFHDLAPRRVRYLGVGQWNTDATFGEAALRGGWFAAPDPFAVDGFLNRYATRHGSRPEMLAVLGYDAVKVAAILARDADGTRGNARFAPDAIARPQGFRGGLGALRFNPDGTNERGLAILEVGDETFDVIEGAPASFGPGA